MNIAAVLDLIGGDVLGRWADRQLFSIAAAHLIVRRTQSDGDAMTNEPPVPLIPVRTKIPLDIQIRVLFRDGWLCRWCHRPTVFGPTFRLLQAFIEQSGYKPRWRTSIRTGVATLLRFLTMGAVIDHLEAFATGGEHVEANFVTACNKCNARKNSRSAAIYEREHPGKPVKGRFGEPKHWDGLTSLFLVLARSGITLTASEKARRKALEAHLLLEQPSNTWLERDAADRPSQPKRLGHGSRSYFMIVLMSDTVKRCRRCCGPAPTGFSFTQAMRRSRRTFTSSEMRTAPSFG